MGDLDAYLTLALLAAGGLAFAGTAPGRGRRKPAIPFASRAMNIRV